MPRLIGASADLVNGGMGVRFVVTRHGKEEPAFVIRYGDKPRAYLNRCAHVPVELDWQPGQFFDFSGVYLICTMHGALYAPESGRCVGGRCDRKGLLPLTVEERDGQILLVEENGKGV